LVGGERSDSIHRLLLAYDGTNKAKRALAWTSKLQRALQCQVVVISVSQDEYAFQEWIVEMRTDIESSDLTNYRFESREGEPAKEIVATAEEEHADLILAGKYEHSAFVDWIIGSTLDHVLQKTPLPLIAA
jgi:nucleotide-binding universal stress UspA family protein